MQFIVHNSTILARFQYKCLQGKLRVVIIDEKDSSIPDNNIYLSSIVIILCHTLFRSRFFISLYFFQNGSRNRSFLTIVKYLVNRNISRKGYGRVGSLIKIGLNIFNLKIILKRTCFVENEPSVFLQVFFFYCLIIPICKT